MTPSFSSITPQTRTFFGCLLILLGIFYAYAQVGGHRFIEFDDALYAYDNRRLIVGFNWENFIWSFTNVDAVNWHPITWLSLFMDRELFGPRPGGYLLMNVAWHSIAACLCYIAFKNTTRSHFIGLTIGLIFALHPANVENVAWLSSRKSILDAAFWFLGIIFYVRLLQTKNRVYYLLVFITHLLGLMSKSMHVTFPCTLWLIHALYHASLRREALQQTPWRAEIKTALLYSAPMLLVSIYFSLVTLSAQTPAMSTLEYMPVTLRVINSTLSYERYLWMFFHPTQLAPFYPLFNGSLHFSQILFPASALLLSTTLCLLAVRKHPVFLIGWLWYLGTLIPVIGLVQVGSQSHADRYLYIPCVGLTLILVSLFSLIPNFNSRAKWFAPLWLALITASIASATKIQVAYWRNGVTLFQHSLAVTGDCMTSVIALSAAYGRQDRLVDGMKFLDKKISISQNPINRAKLYTQCASLAMANNESEKALKMLIKSIETGLATRQNYILATGAALASNNIAEAERYYNLVKITPSTGNTDFSLNSMNLELTVKNIEHWIKQKKREIKTQELDKALSDQNLW